MRKTISLLIGLSLLFTLGLASLPGCGGADVKTQTTTVSEGQQLIDLQKAYKSGAITKEQYDDQKQKILDR
ncbi:MAG: gas vesicle protein GvpG [Desulfarculaceae bacterium]|nr:gas vesicle protein GvpG [Desulfarculaceae bacterium]MCF8072171.1 gas vesicle protein GvpG [Desulfarculaceae bacterium]MCF8100092.1 gas vesicle protein GvpG [Desulfarculaceae bacterium]MCF8117933.1 gas vesicle protein GvpG [Desulfarculaceae bacterium]